MENEKILPANEESQSMDQEESDEKTSQSPLAYRIAAIILLTGLAIRTLDTYLSGSASIPNTFFLGILIDVSLAFGLFRLWKLARNWVIIRLLLGFFASSILAFGNYDPFSAIVLTIGQLGYSGSIILLLTGKTRKWRLALAISAYVVLSLVPFLLLMMVIALGN